MPVEVIFPPSVLRPTFAAESQRLYEELLAAQRLEEPAAPHEERLSENEAAEAPTPKEDVRPAEAEMLTAETREGDANESRGLEEDGVHGAARAGDSSAASSPSSTPHRGDGSAAGASSPGSASEVRTVVTGLSARRSRGGAVGTEGKSLETLKKLARSRGVVLPRGATREVVLALLEPPREDAAPLAVC